MSDFPHGDAPVPSGSSASPPMPRPLDEALQLARADPMVRAGRLTIDGARWLTASGTARFGADG